LTEEQPEEDHCAGQDEFQTVDIPEKIAQLLFIDGKFPHRKKVQTQVRNHKQDARYR
jgi:hypothetical protein